MLTAASGGGLPHQFRQCSGLQRLDLRSAIHSHCQGLLLVTAARGHTPARPASAFAHLVSNHRAPNVNGDKRIVVRVNSSACLRTQANVHKLRTTRFDKPTVAVRATIQRLTNEL